MNIQLMIHMLVLFKAMAMVEGAVHLTSPSEATDGEPYTMSCRTTIATFRPHYWYLSSKGNTPVFVSFHSSEPSSEKYRQINEGAFRDLVLSKRLTVSCNDYTHNATIILVSALDNGSVWWCTDQDIKANSNTLTIAIKSSPTTSVWRSRTTSQPNKSVSVSVDKKNTAIQHTTTPLVSTKTTFPRTTSHSTLPVINNAIHHSSTSHTDHVTLTESTVKDDSHISDSSTKYIIAASISGGLLLCVVVIIVVCCIRRKSSKRLKSEICRSSSAVDIDVETRNATLQEDMYKNEETFVMEDNILYASSTGIVDGGNVGRNVQDILRSGQQREKENRKLYFFR